MTFLARPMARNLWAAMLWLMRRPWMRRFQRRSMNWMREPGRSRAWERFRRQERFARRYGLKILTGVLTVCLYSIAFMAIYQALLTWMVQGWLPGRSE